MDQSIIIIGAGIAGLSAGCYGQMNGFRTRILEMHDKAGGLCTSWRRGDYTIDGSLNWLVGAAPGSPEALIWEELGALEGRDIVYFDAFLRFEGNDGNVFTLYTDVDRLESHMHTISPVDYAVTAEFIAAVRKLTRFEWLNSTSETGGMLQSAKSAITRLLPFVPLLWKWHSISIRDFASRFKSPVLRDAFLQFIDPDLSMSIMLLNFAWFHRGVSGYPVGGSLGFSSAIARRYRSLGGEVEYKSRVRKILVRDDRAVGVALEDGREFYADYVISACDGYATLFKMLEGKYVDKHLWKHYRSSPVYQPTVQVALGLARSFDDLPRLASGLYFPLKKPAVIAGTIHGHFGAHIYNFDPTLAPAGKTVLKVGLRGGDYDYWQALRSDETMYKAEKERIARSIISLLNERFPRLDSQVEMYDVATPCTYHRYTGNWQASSQGWKQTPKAWRLGERINRTLPRLRNFYMAGHWVEPGGGLPPAALSGRQAIRMICKGRNKTFTAMRT